jgi:primosomal protein N' (replication factor Y)
VVRIGAGTQQLERTLAARLPELTVLRLDAETAALAGKHAAVLERFAATDRSVLVGTQMVAKGHHFVGVELAAVVDAGTELAFPDFRAEERTFQSIVQLAGRSGRDRPGRVIVQAWDPDVRPVALAARGAIAEFLESELERRRELSYPPFGHLVRLLVAGPDAERPLVALREIRAALERAATGATILGPAPLLRLRARHRAQLLVKTSEPRRVATAAAGVLASAAAAMRRDGLTASVDVDPQ